MLDFEFACIYDAIFKTGQDILYIFGNLFWLNAFKRNYQTIQFILFFCCLLPYLPPGILLALSKTVYEIVLNSQLATYKTFVGHLE